MWEVKTRASLEDHLLSKGRNIALPRGERMLDGSLRYTLADVFLDSLPPGARAFKYDRVLNVSFVYMPGYKYNYLSSFLRIVRSLSLASCIVILFYTGYLFSSL